MGKVTGDLTYVKVTGLGELDVEAKYEKLMKASVGADSIYIRAKDTMTSYLDDSSTTKEERAKTLAAFLDNMTASLSANAMGTALAWAKEERDGVYEITKLREDTLLVQAQREKVGQDGLVAEQQVKSMEAQAQNEIFKGWSIQADLSTTHGAGSLPAADQPLLAHTGSFDTYLDSAGIANGERKLKLAQIHATYAKTFREHGNVDWTMDANGETNGKVTDIADLDTTNPGLVKAQEDVAIRQEKGFDDNMVQHALNGSSQYMAMGMSSGDIINTDIEYGNFSQALSYLTHTGLNPTAVCSGNVIDHTVSTAVTINGFASFIPDGSAVASYTWAVIQEPASSSLSGGTGAAHNFTPLYVGTYVFSLVIEDGSSNESAADFVSITVV